MSRTVRRRVALQAGLGLGLLSLLPRARACEFFTTTLRITHPWARATAAGEDSAVVGMRIDMVTEAERLIGATTPFARGVELGWHGRAPGPHVALPAGQDVDFGEGGALLRLVGLTQPLEIGCSYPLQLVFARGGTVNATLTIDYGPRFL